MSALKRGMVIDVNLEPTQGSETGKVRPCVIVTNDIYNERVPSSRLCQSQSGTRKKAVLRRM